MSERQDRSKRILPEDEGEKWWYSLKTNQVEYGAGTPGKYRMGPYPDRASAEAALSTARARNEAWDEEEEKWND